MRHQSNPSVLETISELDLDNSSVVDTVVSNAEAIEYAVRQLKTAFLNGDIDKLDALMKRHGTSGVVMSLFERKLNELGLQCHWRLERSCNTRIGHLRIRGAGQSISFSSKVGHLPKSEAMKKLVAGVTLYIQADHQKVVDKILSSLHKTI